MIKQNPVTGEEQIVSPFTDDDLKRLQKMLDPEGMEPYTALPIDKFRALLARLEAAEKCMGYPYVEADWEAWRKASGK